MFSKASLRNPLVAVVLRTLVITLSVTFALLIVRAVPTGFGRQGLQAVFLSNGQVYFGRMLTENERTVLLTDVYYLKLARPILSLADLQSEDASLVKLGNELHAPEDRMEISRSQILFIEKLKEDGKVAQAIKDFALTKGR